MKMLFSYGFFISVVLLSIDSADAQVTPYTPDPTWRTEDISHRYPPHPFSTIPLDHLRMKEFPADTAASAVVLFDFGNVFMDRDQNVIFQRHRRVKILDEEGMKWGTHEIQYYTEPISQVVKNIEAITVNLGPGDYSIIRPLHSSDLRYKKVTQNINKVVFTLPDIRPGSVVEYRYEIVSENPSRIPERDYRLYPELQTESLMEYRYDLFTEGPGLFPDWKFQTTEPVLWSEYNVRIPEFLEFYYNAHISQSLYVSDSKPYTLGPTRFDRGQEYRWVMIEVPALREQPFITTLDDYTSRITFQLAYWYHRQGTKVALLKTWDDLVKSVLRNREFRRAYSPHRTIRRLASSLVEESVTPVERLKTIYDYVRENVEWNGAYEVIPSARMRDILDSGIGNSADVALLLAGMLRSVDIDAYPVILSTRDNGKIEKRFPVLTQFNHMIVFSDVDGEMYLLDGTDRYSPVNVLPYNSLNGEGLLLKEGEVTWVTVEPSVKHGKSISGTVIVDEEGMISGVNKVVYEGYGGTEMRRILQEKGAEEFKKAVVEFDGDLISIDSIVIMREEDIYVPLIASVHISSENYISKDGDYVYLNPVIIARKQNNPLIEMERTIPVDYAYPRESSIFIEIQIPQGFTVKEMPDAVNLYMRDDSVLYTRSISVEEGIISYQRKFQINQVVFPPREYRRLRNFYERVISLESEEIILELDERLTGYGESNGKD